MRLLPLRPSPLYETVAAGTPIDVYMSSHMGLHGQLLADGKMVYDSWTMYATGRIVLWTVEQRFDIKQGMGLLSHPALKKIATPNGGSPYLLAALAAIDHAGLLDKTTPLLLYSDSAQEMVKSVKAGQAQLAFLPYETVLASPMRGVGKYYLIPETAYRQELPGHAAVVTLHGKPNPLAYRFILFLKSAKAQAILAPKGFMKPPAESVDVR